MASLVFGRLSVKLNASVFINSKVASRSGNCSYLLRCFSNSPVCERKQTANVVSNESEIVKSVYISQSTDIFTNLALEDWMYKNFDFSKQHILLLWKNSPCVVIGRHQNPWLEANLAPMIKNNVEIARRNSGGGTVYHDHGNLNLSFFTPREHYNRKRNLELIAAALSREWNIEAEINSREDMVIEGSYKVSFFIAFFYYLYTK